MGFCTLLPLGRHALCCSRLLAAAIRGCSQTAMLLVKAVCAALDCCSMLLAADMAFGRWSTCTGHLVAGLHHEAASSGDSPKRLAYWSLCRLRPGLWLAVCGQHHGQLVWQGQEGAGHGCLEQPHLCGQHAGELSCYLVDLSQVCNCLLDLGAVSVHPCQDHTIEHLIIHGRPAAACLSWVPGGCTV